MMSTDERIARLERSNRWMRIALAMLVVGLICAGLMAASNSPGVTDQIKARKVYIVDSQDRVGMKLHAKDGLGCISFWDADLKKQSPQITIGCIDAKAGGGTQIFMKNAKGERAVNIVAQKKGNVHTW